MYVSGPCYGPSVESDCLGNRRYTTAIFGHYFIFIMDVHNIIYATQTHSCVKSNLKLRLQNNVGAKFSWPYVYRKPKVNKPETQKTYSLFIWGFVQDHRK